MQTKLWRQLPALLVVVLIAGCGGGVGGTGINNGGGGATAVSAGQVTDFGSIFVNGVEFSTNGTTITRDDVAINENELRRGMVVEVRGSIDDNNTTGTAVTVAVEEAVRGPVESKSGSATAGLLVVLGQTVQVDDTTRYDSSPGNFGNIAAGNLLEIHGHRLANGTIQATYIEGKIAPVVYSVRGTVAGHNAGGTSFTIGALTLNYSTAIINDMPVPSGSNWNGLFVEVKGNTCATLPVCGSLTASKVEPEGLSTENAARAEVEGNVTALVSTSDFTVGSQHVVTTGSTIFSGGLQEDIILGAKLEAEGSLVAGVLTASKISFRDKIRLEANIATIDLGAGTVTLSNLPGITVAVNTFTEFGGSGSPSSLNDFSVGDHVRIRGRVSTGTTVVATEFEMRSADTRVILQGPVDSIANPNVVILGVTVNTSTIQNTNFKDLNDVTIGSTAFFSALTVGKLVKARMDLNGMVMEWEEIEFED